jgi:hypothetical protein
MERTRTIAVTRRFSTREAEIAKRGKEDVLTNPGHGPL